MTAPRKDNFHLTEKGVLTEDALLAYLHNTLSPEQRQEVEKLLQADIFARVALEGMQAAPSKTEASSSLLSINQKIRDRVDGKRKRGGKLIQLHWTNYAWAAVIFGLLISLGFVLVNYMDARQENIAMNQEPVQEELLETPKQEPQLISADKNAGSESAAAATSEGPVSIETKPDARLAPTIPTIPSSTTSSAPPASANAAPLAKEGLAKEKAETVPATGAANADRMDMKSTAFRKAADQNSAAAEEIQKEVSVETAMKSFNSGDYKTSSAQFDALLKKQPSNADALYFGGISDYINDDIRKSEKNFDALLKEGTRFVEGSKWYKANILLKKGKKEEAKKLLQDLSITGGSYKERANKKLAELE